MKTFFSCTSLSFLKLPLLIITVICISSNCKPKEDTRPYGPQYEEDPGPERGTTAERLQGSWHIEDYLKDGVSIFNQLNSAASGTITLDKVYFSFTMATKDNGWHENRIIEPWPCYFGFNQDIYTFSSATPDSIFTFWFLNPQLKINNSAASNWTIKKLYKNSFFITLTNSRGTYKIMWKR